MGNQQSGGAQLCSRGELETNVSDMTKYKTDPQTRIGYSISTTPKIHVQPLQKACLLVVPQQQIQEEAVEIPLSGPGKLKILKKSSEKQGGYEETQEEPMYAAEREYPAQQVFEAEQSNDYLAVFEGLHGNVTIKKQGTLSYTDINGTEHSEDYDRDVIRKIFPMGISIGGLTKSIWFKHGSTRDEAFDFLSSLPPSFNVVMNNPSKYVLPEDDNWDDDAIRMFDGINGRKVVVHSDNLVLFTDIDNKKHCLHFNPYKIKKCFPYGIHGRDLPRTIWFDKPKDRDQCFMAMRLIEEKLFNGLNGTVFLHSDSQIEYTSLSGDRMKCFYVAREIQETFPHGISFGGLPKTIWFPDINECKKCIEAMLAV